MIQYDEQATLRAAPGAPGTLLHEDATGRAAAPNVRWARGQGALVCDAAGRTFIDFACGRGANTLGHDHPAVVEAIGAALSRGVHVSSAAYEHDAAAALVGLIPRVEQATFFHTGAEARAAAVRRARHLTGRDAVISVRASRGTRQEADASGVPAALRALTLTAPLEDEADERALLELVRTRGDACALLMLAVPVHRVPATTFLHALVDACRERGMLFALDESVTGFRIALGGAQEFYELSADFVCLARSLAPGMPLAALVGPRSTLGPRAAQPPVVSALPLAVCRAALAIYRQTDYLERISRLGRRLLRGVNAACAHAGQDVRVVGWDAIPYFALSDDPREQTRRASLLVDALAERGVLLDPQLNFLSSAHTERQIDSTIAALVEAVDALTRRGVWARP